MGQRPSNMNATTVHSPCFPSSLRIVFLKSVLVGVAFGKAAANAAEVVGLDRSALMVRQATRRPSK